MFLLGLSFCFATIWCVYSIVKKDITFMSFIFSWLAFSCSLGFCLFYPAATLVLWTLFLLVLSIGCLGIVRNNMEEE